jgi:hypothetical protein
VRTGRCLTTDADVESFEVEVNDGQITILIQKRPPAILQTAPR